MYALKEARRARQLSKKDIKTVRNEVTSKHYKLNNYRSLGPIQKAFIDELIDNS